MRAWFTPPVLGDDSETHTAQLLHVLLLAFVALGVLYFTLSTLLEPANAVRYAVQALVGCVASLGLLALTRSGQVRLAGYLSVGILWVFLAVSVATSGGLSSDGYPAFFMAILTAGLVLGLRWAIGVASLTGLFGLALWLAENQSWLPAHPPPTLASIWVNEALFMGMMVVLLGLTDRTVRRALHRAHAELAERRHTEQALRASEARLRALLDNLPDLITRHDTRQQFIFASPTFTQLFSRPLSDFIGQPLATLPIPDQARTQWQQALQRVLATQERVEIEFAFTPPGGGLEHYETRLIPEVNEEGQVASVLSISRNVTARHKAELAARESEELYRHAIEATGAVPYYWDYATQSYRFIGEGVAALTGYAAAEMSPALLATLTQEVYPLGDPTPAPDTPPHNTLRQSDARLVTRTGENRWISNATVEIVDEGGQAVGAVGILQNITERREAEEKILQLNQQLEHRVAVRTSALEKLYHDLELVIQMQGAILDSAPYMIVATNTEGRIETFNRQAERGLGWSAVEMLGQPYPMHVYDPRELVRRARVLSAELGERIPPGPEVILAKARRGFVDQQEWMIRRKDGTRFPMSSQVVGLRDSEGHLTGFLGIAQDNTVHHQTEEAMRASEEKFRALADNNPLQITRYDREARYLYINAQGVRLMGRPLNEIIGRSVRELIRDPEVAAFGEAQVRRVFETGQPLRTEYQLGEMEAVWWLAPEFDEHGQVASVITTTMDISDRKQAEEALRASEARFRAISDASPLGMFVEDPTGQCIYANAAYLAILGQSMAEALSGGWKNALHPEERVQVLQRWEEARVRQTFHENVYRLLHPDGEVLWVSGQFAPMHDGPALLGFVGILEDITDRVLTEDDLRQRGEELEAANAALAKAARLKDEFLASMSHELRTPLTGILALAEALQKQIYGTLTERQLKSLRSIEESGRHLLDLINDILDLSKIEAGKMELQLETVGVEEVCQSSLRLVKQMAQTKRLNVGYTISPMDMRVRADNRRLKQMLVNLLSNAVKFTPEGGALGLQVEGVAKEGVLRFTVWDTGIGIAPDNLPKLFQAFVQLDSRLSRQYSGTGLGLALVGRMAEIHGGSVHVESEVGKGSRFTIALPWQPETLGTGGLPPAPKRGTGNLGSRSGTGGLSQLRRALTVEDSPIAAEQITRYLDELGVANVVHPLAQGTVEKALILHPSVVLLDLYLPDQSGWNVLLELKANVETRHIPVVIVSVHEDRARAAALGATEYLVKPFGLADLQRVLSAVASVPPAPPTSPVLVVSPTPPPTIAAPVADQPPVRVLLAEDNETTIMVMVDLLEAEGFAVEVARNGSEAIDKARVTRPDLILMDVQMPALDGLEATRQLRRESAFLDTPIIALTALAMPGDRERCLAAGADEYLTKPVNFDKLFQLMRNLLRTRG